MDDFAALRLQLEWGADEALDDLPIDRMVARAVSQAIAQAMPQSRTAAENAPVAAVRSPPAAPAPLQAPQARAQEVANAANTLGELRAAMAAFDGCALAATATQLVFSDGNPESGLMIIGEAPGAEEDRVGKPFVGPSGMFLDRMLASVGLDRTQYLITNLVPTDSEVALCLPFLLRHIALVKPQRIVLMGGMAAQSVLGVKTGITRLRGRWNMIGIPGLDQPIPALPMLHPAYLLRSPGAKRDAWRDVLTLRRHLDSGGA